MTRSKLYSYLKSLSESRKSPFPIEMVDISFGDKYYNESGGELRFEILGKNYQVGYSYITEDADDWAQAESYQLEWCRCDESEVDVKAVYDLIEGYISLMRDSKISDILK